MNNNLIILINQYIRGEKKTATIKSRRNHNGKLNGGADSEGEIIKKQFKKVEMSIWKLLAEGDNDCAHFKFIRNIKATNPTKLHIT